MCKYLMIILIAGICSLADATWEAIGPEGGYIRSIVVSATNADLLYGATYYSPSKIIKSTDAGDTWTKVGSYTNTNYCMAIDPTDDNKLYAGTYARVYRSTNGGVTWTLSNSISYVYFYGLAVHPTNPTTIYGAGRKYVSSANYDMVFLKSTDSGLNWTSTSLEIGGYSYGWSVAIDPSNPNTIYLGGSGYTTTYNPKVYKSTDGGSTWNEVYTATAGYYVYSVAVHPTNSDIVYAGTYLDGIYRTTDGGSSWTKVHTGNYSYRMATTPDNPDVAFASGYYYVYRSTNAGLSWSTVITGLPAGGYYYGLAINPDNASDVYIGSNSGFYKSTNMGTNWYESNNGLLLADIIGMGVAPSLPSTMYITFEDIAVYKTTNNGDDWTRLPSFSSCGDMCAFGINNTDPNTVIALEGYG